MENKLQIPSFQKKIDPEKSPEKISVFPEPTDLALKEWQLKGLKLPDMSIINSYRKARVIRELQKN